MTISSEIVSGKTAIGVVVGGRNDNSQRYIIGLKETEKPWSLSATDSSLSNFVLKEDAVQDKSGKNSTAVLVAELGDNSNYAGGYCYNYTTSGTTKGQWYLPSAGEIYNYFYANYTAINNAFLELGLNSFGKNYWSSSEYSYLYAWGVGSSSGTMGGYGKDGNLNSVSCLLAL